MGVITRTDKIAVKESMQNLADYVSTLNLKTDKTLYLHFQSIINREFDMDINNKVKQTDEQRLFNVLFRK